MRGGRQAAAMSPAARSAAHHTAALLLMLIISIIHILHNASERQVARSNTSACVRERCFIAANSGARTTRPILFYLHVNKAQTKAQNTMSRSCASSSDADSHQIHSAFFNVADSTSTGGFEDLRQALEIEEEVGRH